MASSKPDSVEAAIYLSSLPGNVAYKGFGRATLNVPLFGIAPEGGCRACQLTLTAGGLLPHRFTLTCPDKLFGLKPTLQFIGTGGFLSVALSAGLPLPAFRQLPALWSPDFPLLPMQERLHRKPPAEIL